MMPAMSTATLRPLAAAAVAALLVLTLAACGSDADSGAGDTSASSATAEGMDLGLFFDGALTEKASTAQCTLAGGTVTTCHTITVTGFPAGGEVGPFCPRTTSATADEVGIWFDGKQVYDIDGEFILKLPEIYDDAKWRLHDEDGKVNVTDTQEAFEGAARPDVDPRYQNHCVEGKIAWLQDGEPVPSEVQIPTQPVAADSATAVGNRVGVTLDGVIIDGQAPVEAILGAYTIAAFDDCGGHINPVEGYHIHGAAGCSESGDAAAGETPVFAFALDGFPIHSPLEDDEQAAAGLDDCNGHSTDALGYHYHAQPPEKNGVLTCFTGEPASTQGGEGRGGGPPGEGPPTG